MACGKLRLSLAEKRGIHEGVMERGFKLTFEGLIEIRVRYVWSMVKQLGSGINV